jgi:hypothetical protein
MAMVMRVLSDEYTPQPGSSDWDLVPELYVVLLASVLPVFV